MIEFELCVYLFRTMIIIEYRRNIPNTLRSKTNLYILFLYTFFPQKFGRTKKKRELSELLEVKYSTRVKWHAIQDQRQSMMGRILSYCEKQKERKRTGQNGDEGL